MSQPDPTPAPSLMRLGGNPPIRGYVASIWRRREFAWNNAVGELRSEHRDTVLGNIWHLVNPLLLIGVYYLVFGRILQTTRGVDNFIAFLAVGVFTFQFSQKAVIGGARAIVSNQGLIRSLQFPRALLPVSTVLRETMSYWSAAVVMLAVVLMTEDDFAFAAWPLIVPSFLLQVVFNLGLALIAARMADRFRDVLNVLPYLFRIAFYLSGVLYAVERYLDESPEVLRLFVINPFYTFISLPREYLMASMDHETVGWMWVSAGIWAGASLAVGLVVFRAGEKEYGRG